MKIKTRKLDVGYNGRPVLRDLNFSIPSGKITVIAGPSGCGKSTVLKTIIGLIPALSGEILFDGKTLDYKSEHSLKDLYDRIGVLFQNGALLNSLRVAENVALPIRMSEPGFPEPVLREMAERQLALVGLHGVGDMYPVDLSGGMRKRAALARSMVREPAILFCDEPSAGLDPITSTGLDELLKGLKEKHAGTLVVVTHELRSIEKIADWIILLNDGQLQFEGTYEDLDRTDNPFIESFFLRK
jgi:phospholipid/cholesterol/gamma-HCH transport system ATP-binding protein